MRSDRCPFTVALILSRSTKYNSKTLRHYRLGSLSLTQNFKRSHRVKRSPHPRWSSTINPTAALRSPKETPAASETTYVLIVVFRSWMSFPSTVAWWVPALRETWADHHPCYLGLLRRWWLQDKGDPLQANLQRVAWQVEEAWEDMILNDFSCTIML